MSASTVAVMPTETTTGSIRPSPPSALRRGPQRLPSEVPVHYPPTTTTGKQQPDYYFGIEDSAYDSWPTVGSHVRKVKIGKNEYQFFEFPVALELHTDPHPHCIPEELLAFKPGEEQVFKYFFRGTKKEVSIRQIFFHTELTKQEQEWLTHIRDYCRWKNFPIRKCIEPFLLRICYYNWRKNGDKGYIPKAYEHLIELANWRASMFPISDKDPEIMEDLRRGVMYWTGRDQYFRPLLIVRLKRLPSSTPPARFKRLTVFCFEWAMLVPGLVETCTVIFDVRGIAIHSFPISALSDMTNTLTRQYPFRLDRMFIINDSVFIQTVWSIAKQFLTEVQQQKMMFMRTGYEKELLKSYAAHHLEKEFGGTRSEGPKYSATSNCYKAIDSETVEGKLWEGNQKQPIKWSSEAYNVFQQCKIPPPAYIIPPPQETVEETKSLKEAPELDKTEKEVNSGVEAHTTTTTTTAILTPPTASPITEVIINEEEDEEEEVDDGQHIKGSSAYLYPFPSTQIQHAATIESSQPLTNRSTCVTLDDRHQTSSSFSASRLKKTEVDECATTFESMEATFTKKEHLGDDTIKKVPSLIETNGVVVAPEQQQQPILLTDSKKEEEDHEKALLLHTSVCSADTTPESFTKQPAIVSKDKDSSNNAVLLENPKKVLPITENNNNNNNHPSSAPWWTFLKCKWCSSSSQRAVRD